MPLPIYVAGRFIQGKSDPLRVLDPYLGRTIASVSTASEKQVLHAVESADRAKDEAAALPSHVRATACRFIADEIIKLRARLTKLMQREAGKVRRDAEGEVRRAEQTFRISAEEAGRIGGELLDLDWTSGSENRVAVVRRFPLGVVSGIAPFNFPLNLVAHKLAPAIASGNCIVLKPASATPLVALELARMIAKTGLPRGMVSVLPARPSEVEPLVEDPRVRLVTFTGSADVGWSIARKAGGRRRVVLELGGNAAVVVADDADIEHVAKRCVSGGYSQAGQSCISVQRIIVHRKVRRAFEKALVRRVKKLRTGDPKNRDTDVGPLIDAEAAKRVVAWIAQAETDGATVLCGGKRRGTIVTPAVIADPPEGAQVWDEEVFGPVVSIRSYDNFDKALEMVNDSRYGLQAGVFTNRLADIAKAFRLVQAGGVVVNDVPTWRADHMPYGGTKDSGTGREGPRYAIEHMTEERTLVLNLS